MEANYEIPIILLVAVLSLSLSCSSEQRAAQSGYAVAQLKHAAPATNAQREGYAAPTGKISLNDVDKEGSTAEGAERKIIRNADITIEVPSTTDAQHRITSIGVKVFTC
jgi:hypothetical protein